jgi:hypothetical protein
MPCRPYLTDFACAGGDFASQSRREAAYDSRSDCPHRRTDPTRDCSAAPEVHPPRQHRWPDTWPHISEQAKRVGPEEGPDEMRRLRGHRFALARAARSAHRAHAAFLAAALIALLAISLAPASVADSTADLQSQVDRSRGRCPPMRSDPVLTGVAQRANGETRSYIEHTARFIPFVDPMPVLHELGYNAGKAKLVAGYGDSDAKAIHGLMLQAWDAVPDCTYTRYGVNVVDNADGGYALAALILAGD